MDGSENQGKQDQIRSSGRQLPLVRIKRRKYIYRKIGASMVFQQVNLDSYHRLFFSFINAKQGMWQCRVLPRDVINFRLTINLRSSRMYHVGGRDKSGRPSFREQGPNKFNSPRQGWPSDRTGFDPTERHVEMKMWRRCPSKLGIPQFGLGFGKLRSRYATCYLIYVRMKPMKGGLVCDNAIPHLIVAVSGRRFENRMGYGLA